MFPRNNRSGVERWNAGRTLHDRSFDEHGQREDKGKAQTPIKFVTIILRRRGVWVEKKLR